MQTYAKLLGMLEDIKLPHGWVLALRASPHESLYLQVQDPNGIDNVTGKPYPWHGRKWILSPHMTNSEVVQTAFMATMAAVEHETREQFLYKGLPIFDPHYDIEQLHLLRMTAALDKRAS